MSNSDIFGGVTIQNSESADAELIGSLQRRIASMESGAHSPYFDFARVQRSTSISVATNTWVKIDGFDTELDLMPATSTAAEDIDTTPVDYLVAQRSYPLTVSCSLQWASESDDWAGSRNVRFLRWPGTVDEEDMGVTEFIATTGSTFVSHSWSAFFEAGETVGVEVYHTAGVTTTISNAILQIVSM